MRAPAWLRYVLVVFMVLAAITLFLLATAAANTARFGEHYPLLLAFNGAVAIALVLLVAYQLYSLRRKLRLRVFGSKLTLRLVLLFALIGIVPGALIYAVSVQFLGKSIESWFEVRIDKALDAGLTLARSTLDTALKDLAAKGESVAAALSLRPPSEHLAVLNAVREQAGVQEAYALHAARKTPRVFGNRARRYLTGTAECRRHAGVAPAQDVRDDRSDSRARVVSAGDGARERCVADRRSARGAAHAAGA